MRRTVDSARNELSPVVNLDAAEQLRRLSEELGSTNRALDTFSHSISHDLRAPLSSIASLLQIIDEDYGERLGEDARGMLTTVRSGCQSLDQMIGALLAFSRCNSQPLDAVQIDMTALARDALHETLAELTATAPAVEMGALPEVSGDLVALRQVWCQLIGNAVKFSSKREHARVKVTGRVASKEAIYQVEDNGVGFDMQYAHRLFAVFQRLHRAEDFTGDAVGLAIAQRIIVRHGGRIWVQAAPNIGATFHFALPL
jgi:two-component system, sensor histidine kinase and response regulator